jgi:Protein of unknown function (DUF2877)
MTRAAVASPLRAIVHGPAVPAKVLGSSPAALYLRLPGGRIVVLLSAQAVPLPLGVVLAERACLAGICGPVRVGAGRINGTAVGDVTVCAEYPTDVRPVGVTAAAVDWVVRRAGRLDTERTGLTAAQREILAGADAEAMVAQLCGAGPGLTPAGDDALCGVLLADAAGLTNSGVAPVLAGCAGPPTTDLSAQLLGLAAAGHAAAPVRDLVAALAQPHELPLRWAAVLRMGHTSGAALAAGFGAALAWRRR